MNIFSCCYSTSNNPKRVYCDNGASWEGDFDHFFNGKGKKINPDGSREEGVFKNGKLNGIGKIYWLNDPRRREGQFKDGLMDGEGIRVEFDGTKIRGNFKEDLLDGPGSIDLIGGGGYYGNFKEGLLEGLGKVRGRKGTIEEGIYKDGMLEEPI